MIYTTDNTRNDIVKVPEDTFFNIKSIENDSIDSFIFVRLPVLKDSQGNVQSSYKYDRLSVTFEREISRAPDSWREASSNPWNQADNPGNSWQEASTENAKSNIFPDSWSIDQEGQTQINSRFIPKSADNLTKRKYLHQTHGYTSDLFAEPPPGVDISDIFVKSNWSVEDSVSFKLGNKEALFHKIFSLAPYTGNAFSNTFSMLQRVPVPKYDSIVPAVHDWGTPEEYDFDPQDILGIANHGVYSAKSDASLSLLDLTKNRDISSIASNAMYETVAANSYYSPAYSTAGSFASRNIAEDTYGSIGSNNLYEPEIQEGYSVDRVSDLWGVSDKSYYVKAAASYLSSFDKRYDDDQITKFEFVRSEMTLDDIEIRLPTKFKTSDQNSSFLVTIKIYEKDKDSPSSTIRKTVDLKSHVDAYYEVTSSPSIEIYNSKNPVNVKVIVKVTGKDSSKCSGVNIYVKGVDSSGTSTKYKLLGKYETEKIVNIAPIDKLNILRAVPVDIRGKESTAYAIKYFGEGHQSIRRIVITAAYRQSDLSNDLEKILLQVHNVPMGASVKVYRRDITDDQKTPKFDLLGSLISSSGGIVQLEDLVQLDRYVEYIATADMSTIGKRQEKMVSNYVILRHPTQKSRDKVINGLSVNIVQNTVSLNVIDETSADVSFTIRTSLTPGSKQIVRDAIRLQFPDLYARYLDPANNKASPLSSEASYDTLVGHEVVRTNMKTAERHTFPIIYSESFVDNASSRFFYGIPAVNPQDTYQYEVFSYVRDPITLLENYIERGKNDLGFEYFYLPYKWFQPKVLSTGVLYPDDDNGYPIVEQFDTLVPAGLRDTYTLRGAKEITEITSVISRRVDISTIRLNWEFESKLARGNENLLYEGFLIMKNANGRREAIGYSTKTYYYHRLSEADAGNIYYTVIPILQDQTMDTPGQSNVLYVDPNDFDYQKIQTPFTNSASPADAWSAASPADTWTAAATQPRTVARGY